MARTENSSTSVCFDETTRYGACNESLFRCTDSDLGCSSTRYTKLYLVIHLAERWPFNPVLRQRRQHRSRFVLCPSLQYLTFTYRYITSVLSPIQNTCIVGKRKKPSPEEDTVSNHSVPHFPQHVPRFPSTSNRKFTGRSVCVAGSVPSCEREWFRGEPRSRGRLGLGLGLGEGWQKEGGAW